MIVNKDCVIVSDFFFPTLTAGNTSFTVFQAIELYAAMVADCEVAKKVNRNWIKLPMLFGIDTSDEDTIKTANALSLEIKQLLLATEDNEDAVRIPRGAVSQNAEHQRAIFRERVIRGNKEL